MISLMFIGGSPGSTAGGIKTTTMLILVLTIWTELRKRKDLELFRRRVESEAIRHACCLMMFYGLLSIGSSMIISTIENLGMKQTLFETVSALCTVGLSLGNYPWSGNSFTDYINSADVYRKSGRYYHTDCIYQPYLHDSVKTSGGKSVCRIK